jgi:hypothetical protein
MPINQIAQALGKVLPGTMIGDLAARADERRA